MAPIKFEDNIREKLQERELQPSKESWNKLASQLGEQPENKNNRVLWMAVAASMAGILLVVSFLFKSGDQNMDRQVVSEEIAVPETKGTVEFEAEASMVGTTDSVQQEAVNLNKVANASANEEFIAKDVNTALANVAKKGQQSSVKNISTSEEKNTPLLKEGEDKKVIVAVNDSEKPNIKNVPELEEDGFIRTKVDEVVASIQDIQKENNTVTVEEIDVLLAKAQRDIATNRILNSENQKIDATALLQDVETELERSFRDKVFDVLGEGFNKVRTAVAERNN